MVDSFIELVNESNKQIPPKKKVNEMGVKAPERLSGSSMGAIRRASVQRRASMPAGAPQRSYTEIAADLTRALRSVRRLDITMERPNGTRDYFVRFPQPIVDLMKEAYRANRSQFIEHFGKWRDVFPTDDDAIHFRTESPNDYQRSHLPNDGIPASLRGLGLGYKMYRTLLKYAGFISSNTSGTSEKDKAWGSMLAYKANPDGTPSEDDAHAIIGPSKWMAIDKGLPDREKIDIAMRFINNIGRTNTQPDRFDMDDELLNLLPDDFLSGLDPAYLRSLVTDGRLSQAKVDAIVASRGEAERREAERQRLAAAAERERLRAEEAQTRKRLIVRLSKFGAAPDEDWDIGDFIVVKQYLYDPNYADLPIRKVVAHRDGEYIAVQIDEAAKIENGTMTVNDSNDTRKTRDKTKWVKVKIDEIPDLNAVNLTATAKRYVENLLNPEVRARAEAERTNAEQARLDAERTANDTRARATQTFGWVPSSGAEIKQALTDRPNLPVYRTTLKSFRDMRFVASLTFIVLGPPQRSAMRNSWGIPVFIPWYGRPNNPRPIRSIDQLNDPETGAHLTNAVTGVNLEGPYVGLGLMAYPLAEVTVDDKIRARAGEHYYISGHQNTFGVIAKSDYGTVNSTRQKFIYVKVFGFDGRSVSVRLDLLRKLGPPVAI